LGTKARHPPGWYAGCKGPAVPAKPGGVPRLAAFAKNSGCGLEGRLGTSEIAGRLLLSRGGYAEERTTQLADLACCPKRLQLGAKLSERISYKIGVSFFLI
jgi:hypothetical protein